MISRTGSGGFTLLEVLVASVILFAGLGAVLKAYSLAVVAMEVSADKLAVCQVLQEQAAVLDLRVAGGGGAGLAGAGSQKVGGFEYRWQVHADSQVVAPEVVMLRAVMEVDRGEGRPAGRGYGEWLEFREKNEL